MNAIRRVARGENAINFIPWWKRGLVFSGVLVLISVASFFVRGLNLGIDFDGGTSWEVSAPGVSVAGIITSQTCSSNANCSASSVGPTAVDAPTVLRLKRDSAAAPPSSTTTPSTSARRLTFGFSAGFDNGTPPSRDNG